MHADQVRMLSSHFKGVGSQEESVQSLALTPGSRLSITKAETVFSRLHVKFNYDGRYTGIEELQHFPTFQWPPVATEDSVAEAACQYLQRTYMPEDIVVIAVQSVEMMGHEWPEASVKVKESRCTDYVMVYKGLDPEMVDIFIEQQRLCAELTAVESQ